MRPVDRHRAGHRGEPAARCDMGHAAVRALRPSSVLHGARTQLGDADRERGHAIGHVGAHGDLPHLGRVGRVLRPRRRRRGWTTSAWACASRSSPISPYTRRGLIDTEQGEFSTPLKFISDNWGLPYLTRTDRGDARLRARLRFLEATTRPRPRSDARTHVQRRSLRLGGRHVHGLGTGRPSRSTSPSEPRRSSPAVT